MQHGRHRRLGGTLAMRAAIVTAVAAILGIISALAVAAAVASELAERLVVPSLVAAYARAGREVCEADPRHWKSDTSGGAVAYAYDPHTLRSENPEAPPIDRELLARLDGGSTPTSAIRMGRVRAKGTLLFRVASSGPCAMVQSTWQGAYLARRPAVLAAGVGFATFVSLLLGWWFVSRPLLRRIGALERAAEEVGHPEANDRVQQALDAAIAGPLSAGRPQDEIDAVATTMRNAHARIVEDARRLSEQREALQRHLADVSHDLRTPISSLHLLLEQIADARGDEERKELVSSALRDAVYLGALTENLRLASAMQAGWDAAAAASRTDLGALVRDVAARASVFAARSSVSLEVASPDEPVWANADALVAARAFANVMENAVAYVGDGGHVAVMLERDASRFSLTVLDDGPELTEATVARMGERTFRSDEARRRDPRGSGLGLAITREICERHGWTLSLRAERPRGLRVVIAGAVVG